MKIIITESQLNKLSNEYLLGNISLNKKENKDKLFSIILTKEQIDFVNENYGIGKKYKSVLHKLCVNEKENKPFCRLYSLSKSLPEDEVVDLEVSMEVLNSYFRFKNVGTFPAIVEMALRDEGRTVAYLKLISDFIQDDKFDKSQIKKTLNRQRQSKTIPKNLEDLLKQARTLEHQKYEQSFEGDYFNKKSTFLKLDYRCDDDAKETLFDILTRVKSEEKTLDIVYERMIRCISKSLAQGTYYVKADLELKQNLTYSGETIFPSGTLFEVKKMDPFIDSYLSEFFSIFKETSKIQYKNEYIGLYNKLIQRIYEWLTTNEVAQQYLQKVKNQMGGIIYDYQTIVPSEYIELYWSNKGQRGCDEKRLSIRFRIKSDVNEIKTYRFEGTNELVPVIKKVPNFEKTKVVCEDIQEGVKKKVIENYSSKNPNQFLKQSLFKYWDIQKKKGNQPKLDEIVYDIAGVKKYTSGDSLLVRPIWYEYNGGYEKLFLELKEKTKGKRFNIKGDNNLNIVVHVDYVTSYGVSNSGGMVDFIVSIDGGTMYYEFYNEDSNEPEIVNNADIFEVYNDLEYDTADLTQFVKDTVEDYFDKKFEYLGIALYVEVNW